MEIAPDLGMNELFIESESIDFLDSLGTTAGASRGSA